MFGLFTLLDTYFLLGEDLKKKTRFRKKTNLRATFPVSDYIRLGRFLNGTFTPDDLRLRSLTTGFMNSLSWSSRKSQCTFGFFFFTL